MTGNSDLIQAVEACTEWYDPVDRLRLEEIITRVHEILQNIDDTKEFMYQASLRLRAYQAVELMESTDLHLLINRYRALDQIPSAASEIGPISDLPVNSFIQYMKNNRDSLIRTGYPSGNFAQSLWLDNRIAKVYPTKLPVAVQSERPPGEQNMAEQEGDAERDDDGNLIYSFTWARRCDENRSGSHWHRTRDIAQNPIFVPGRITEALFLDGNIVNTTGGFDWRGDHLTTADGCPVEPCPYEDAPIIPGLFGDDVARMEVLREAYFDAKIEVLPRLQSALEGKNRSTLRENVLQILQQRLTANDLCFLHGMDEKYRTSISGTGRNLFADDSVRDVWHGGIDDLLYVVGFCECEYRTAFNQDINRIVREISDIIPSPLQSYFDSLNQKWQPSLDEHLDRWVELQSINKEWWTEYWTSFDEIFNQEHAQDVVEISDTPSPPQHDSRYMIDEMNGAWKIIYDGYSLQPFNDTMAMRSLIKILTTPTAEGVTAKSWLRGSDNPEKLLDSHISQAEKSVEGLRMKYVSTESNSTCNRLLKHLEEHIPSRSSAIVRYTGDITWQLNGKLPAHQRTDKRKKKTKPN